MCTNDDEIIVCINRDFSKLYLINSSYQDFNFDLSLDVEQPTINKSIDSAVLYEHICSGYTVTLIYIHEDAEYINNRKKVS